MVAKKYCTQLIYMATPLYRNVGMAKYDAVICGAGPSGATAAKYMADKGLSVLLLEKSSFPRDKPCGGALRPGVLEEFEHVKSGLRNIPYAVCSRTKMYSPSLNNFVDYNPKKAIMYQVQRSHFDAMLAELAESAGAELRENAEVKAVFAKDNGHGLHMRGGEEVSGNVIIGAGGMHDPVAQYLRRKEGLPKTWPESDIGLAVVEEYEVGEDFIVERFGEEHTSYFHLKPNNLYGYAWTFSKQSTLNIGFGAFWKHMKNANIKEVLASYLTILKKEGLAPENLRVGRPKGGKIPLRGCIKTSYSQGMLILGDAAGFVSPIGGDGIYFAMCSGRIAADVVEYAVEHDTYGKEIMSRYQQEWYKQWGKDLKALCYFADKISAKTEQVLKYASRDKVLRDMCVGLYDGEGKPSEMKWKIIRRMARDFALYDVLRLK